MDPAEQDSVEQLSTILAGASCSQAVDDAVIESDEYCFLPARAAWTKRPDDWQAQERRRAAAREMQLLSKKKYKAAKRAAVLAELGDDEADELEFADEAEGDSVFRRTGKARRNAQKRRRAARLDFRRQLQHAEYVHDIPSGFPDDWLAVPCPRGRRRLVLASRGRTLAFDKSGCVVDRFMSLLPGGSPASQTRGHEDRFSMLDALFVEETRTFVVLDVLRWNGLDVCESDVSFRFFWRDSRLAEAPDCARAVGGMNEYAFVAASAYDCSPAGMAQAFAHASEVPLDGLLLYHRGASYVHGLTAFVLWVEASLVDSIFGALASGAGAPS